MAARGLPIEIVAAYDYWDAACTTYSINHELSMGVHEVDLSHAGIRNEVVDNNRGIDIVLGGIPCQWLSSYRRLTKLKPSEVEEGVKLLDGCLEIVCKLNPRWWCLEDVVQLEPHLPLTIPRTRLNSKNFSAQRRKRTYVGEFPRPGNPMDKRVLRDLVRPGPYRIGRRGIDRKLVVSRSMTKETALKADLNRKAPTVVQFSSRRDGELLIEDFSLPTGKRQFEWQELAVLQGFPTDYVFFGSPTDVCIMVGNAIQIDTGRAILEAIVADAKLKKGA